MLNNYDMWKVSYICTLSHVAYGAGILLDLSMGKEISYHATSSEAQCDLNYIDGFPSLQQNLEDKIFSEIEYEISILSGLIDTLNKVNHETPKQIIGTGEINSGFKLGK
ncbi:hypothetical protein NQ317_018329 [Molorchus minor]|uniref:Uncharacterized protein n=1 Tax=Molorchus minor TaxID=1323400 RepID=A0ABQ9J3X9_9CUCU|nr:hypothetical protein NQ317_018329 [Molorchus minor]